MGTKENILTERKSMSIKVSIIIPVYNVAKWLSECMDSVCAQTLKEIEIICVNDGSTDNSLDILENYVRKDKRIRIVSQKNQGLSMARNAGMPFVTGKYVTFLDSDDYLAPTYCEKMYALAEKDAAEWTACDCFCFDDTKQKVVPNILEASNERLIREFAGKVFSFDDVAPLCFNQMCGAAWGKLYRTDFIKKNGLSFAPGVPHEDYPYFYQALTAVKRGNVCPDSLVYYRINRAGSITHNVGRKGFSFIGHFQLIEQSFRKNGKYDAWESDFLKLKINGLMYWLWKTPGEHRRAFYGLIQQEFRRMDLSPATLGKLPAGVAKTYKRVKTHGYDYAWIHKNVLSKLASISYDENTKIRRIRFLFVFKIKRKKK